VLWEQRTGELWEGVTDTYIRVYVQSEHALFNELLPARLMALERDGARGELVSAAQR
jgi:hypothetical protein